MGRWIEWMQKTLSEYYIYSRQLYVEAKDVEIVKDHLTVQLERSNFRVNVLQNEKEDYEAREQSEHGIKEYLATKAQSLTRKNLEQSTQILLLKQEHTVSSF